MMNLDANKLTRIAQDALAKVADSKRWQNAIRRAESLLLDNPFWHVTDEGALLLLSPDSSELYETDGVVCERINGERRVASRVAHTPKGCRASIAPRTGSCSGTGRATSKRGSRVPPDNQRATP